LVPIWHFSCSRGSPKPPKFRFRPFE
jgi:hypothetical protein